MLIDTHSHLCSPELFDMVDDIVGSFKQDNIEAVICPSYDIDSCHKTLELVNKYESVYGALGIHPTEIDEWDNETVQLLEKNLINPKIVAVGEIGFDFHYETNTKKSQAEILLQQLLLAKNNDLPVIFHVRDAWDEFIDFIKSNRDLITSGVVHCFDGDANIAKQILNTGLKISFTGLITHKKPYLWDAVKYVPIDNMMIETDSPYLLPHNAKTNQKWNEPKFVYYVAEQIASIKQMNIGTVIDKTTQNAYELFKKMR